VLTAKEREICKWLWMKGKPEWATYVRDRILMYDRATRDALRRAEEAEREAAIAWKEKR